MSVPSGFTRLKTSWGFTFKSILITTLTLWSGWWSRHSSDLQTRKCIQRSYRTGPGWTVSKWKGLDLGSSLQVPNPGFFPPLHITPYPQKSWL